MEQVMQWMREPNKVLKEQNKCINAMHFKDLGSLLNLK